MCSCKLSGESATGAGITLIKTVNENRSVCSHCAMRKDGIHRMSLVTIFPPTFGDWVSLSYGCHFWNVPHLAHRNCITPYDGCGELTEFPNFWKCPTTTSCSTSRSRMYVTYVLIKNPELTNPFLIFLLTPSPMLTVVRFRSSMGLPSKYLMLQKRMSSATASCSSSHCSTTG
jgi:hypothetical protein